MKRSLLMAVPLMLCAPLLTAAAAEMTAGEFLEAMKKAESLGPAALLSSDARALRTETERVRKRYIDDQAKQKSSGGARHSCPPNDGKPRMTGDELRNYLTTLSPAQKKQPFRVAVYNLMKQKYPCK